MPNTQGKNFTAIFADESGNYPVQAFGFLNLLRSNLRVPLGKRAHIHMTANPHGRSHTKLFKGWINQAPYWRPYQDESGEWWVNCHTTFKDNPHIDREAYERQLDAAAAGDVDLAKAWKQGSFEVLGGVMFDMWTPDKHIIPPLPRQIPASYLVGADWGTAAPATALLIARVKDPVHIWRPGDYIVVDETDTAIPTDLSIGTGASIFTWAEMIQEMLARNARSKGTQIITDDARGLNGDTVVNEFHPVWTDRSPSAQERSRGERGS